VNNSAVIATSQHLPSATCTDVPLQPDQGYSLHPGLTHQASAHALMPHLTSVRHLPGIYLQASGVATAASAQPNFQPIVNSQPVDSSSIDLSLPTSAHAIRSASFQSACPEQMSSTTAVASDWSLHSMHPPVPQTFIQLQPPRPPTLVETRPPRPPTFVDLLPPVPTRPIEVGRPICTPVVQPTTVNYLMDTAVLRIPLHQSYLLIHKFLGLFQCKLLVIYCITPTHHRLHPL